MKGEEWRGRGNGKGEAMERQSLNLEGMERPEGEGASLKVEGELEGMEREMEPS